MISSSLKAAACISGIYTLALDLYEVLSWSWRVYKDAAALHMHTVACNTSVYFYCYLFLFLSPEQQVKQCGG